MQSKRKPVVIIPAQAGIQCFLRKGLPAFAESEVTELTYASRVLDSRLRGNDHIGSIFAELWMDTAREFGDPIRERKGERLLLA